MKESSRRKVPKKTLLVPKFKIAHPNDLLSNKLKSELFKQKMKRYSRYGFTLVELLVVIGIIAILVAISFAAYGPIMRHAQCAGCSAHMRTLGVAFMTYATDNDGQLPGRVTQAGNDKWPTLLLPYANDPRNYVDPGDAVASKTAPQDLVSNSSNHSSFFFNGFDDLGFYNNSSASIRLSNLTNTSRLFLLGQKVSHSSEFYMDFIEGNQDDVLNKMAYPGGSNYLFADGSVQFIREIDYQDTMWLVNQNYSIPSIPAGH